MTDFAPVVVRRQAVLAAARGTADERRWSGFKPLCREQLQGQVSGVAFSPRFPYELAAASNEGVSIFNSTVGEQRRKFSRFKGAAHSPCYKHDGRLLVAGDDNAIVQVFDIAKRNVLRHFRGHDAAVWTTKFSLDGLRVLSGSDDRTVRMWDLATGVLVLTLSDSEDYVRAQAPSPASKHVWCVGSYDGRARVYDLRSKSIVATLDHGSQVSDVRILPGGLRAVTVGGTDVKVWDLLNPAEPEHCVSNHAKAVTACVVHPEKDRLITAGQDGQVKVIDTSTFEVCATMHYNEQLISLAISDDGKRIGTGSLEGVTEIRVAKAFTKGLPQAPVHGGLKERQFEGWGMGFEKPRTPGPRPGTRRFFERGRYSRPDKEDIVVDKGNDRTKVAHDRYLRSFSHGRALAAAADRMDPATLIAVVDELASRKALANAMSSCTDEAVVDILVTIMKSIDLPQYTSRLVDVMNILIDVRAMDFGVSAEVDGLLSKILFKVQKEVGVCNSLRNVDGYIDTVMRTAALNAADD